MVARIAGYSAELLDGFMGKLGKPIGVATYKPCNSVGEEYLPDYLGMIGVPIDLVPEFPTTAKTVILTAASHSTRISSPRPRSSCRRRPPSPPPA